ncbi:hypothetical protein [Kitasatospora sp. NPDC056731]|uniref:hypothetical protein n=1 Tax=Kitasatospora sp. NPDC056731 TaxID=3155422 RepID=UPI00342649A9
MFTREDNADAHALRQRGRSISAIGRYLGRDRKTTRAYVARERIAGVRAPALDEFVRSTGNGTSAQKTRQSQILVGLLRAIL